MINELSLQSVHGRSDRQMQKCLSPTSHNAPLAIFVHLHAAPFVNVGILTTLFQRSFSHLSIRTRLLGACVVLFSACGSLMALATEYWHLVVLRMGIAAGYKFEIQI